MIDPFFNVPDWNAEPPEYEPKIAKICDGCGRIIYEGETYFTTSSKHLHFELCEDCIEEHTAEVE